MRRHWFVDPERGVASCGAVGIALMHANDVLDVDCARCLADPEYQYEARTERARRKRITELRERFPETYRHVSL